MRYGRRSGTAPTRFRSTSLNRPLAVRRRGSFGRVEDGRGSLGHSATLRFPSPLIEPTCPIKALGRHPH
jgi:hypothetical protein